MSVTKDDVRKVARLSRIAVTDAHAEELVGELNGILNWIDQLNEVDVDDIRGRDDAAHARRRCH